MMARTTTMILVGAALLATAACTKKRPEVLPPPPGDAVPMDPNGTGPGGGDTFIPGSSADFKRSVSSDTVNFGTDGYDIDATARGILDSQTAWLQRYPNVRITLEGHCDERGTREYNLALGDRRANAAKNYLVARGIQASRITTISYGKERPLALGSDDGSYAQNRRAVTVVLS